MNKIKIFGQTFTEYNEVCKMLDLYKGDLLSSKIIEPSFGNGQFLTEIFRRIIEKGRLKFLSNEEILTILKNNVYGYELDTDLYNITLNNINNLLNKYDIKTDIKFNNLKNSSTFNCLESNFDLVIGNPPYVRIQNLDQSLKNVDNDLKLTSGNTDLYLMFIDFYLHKLSKYGQLIFIVPNSIGKSKSALKIREFMYTNGVVDYIDFEDKQLFSNVSVYSSIFSFKNNIKDVSTFRIGFEGDICNMSNYSYFEPTTKVNIPNLQVKNGICTLADSVFIFKNIPQFIEPQYVKKLYKGSKQDLDYFIIFPYKIVENKVWRFKDDIELKEIAPKLYEYLLSKKEILTKIDIEKNSNWFEYGRSQAINDILKEKWIIDTLIKPNQKKLLVKKIPSDTLVFSGLYSTSNLIEIWNNYDLIKSLRFRCKDMKGGYKKLSSSLLKPDNNII